jgi:hypothetical protein
MGHPCVVVGGGEQNNGKDKSRSLRDDNKRTSNGESNGEDESGG